MPKKRPWVKWYWTDWRSDPRLRMCSLAARGLWAEMLALCDEADPYGHLLVNGVAPTDTQLASLAGAPTDQIPDLLRELESAGVFSRARNRVIYSRRMVRDEKRRKDGETAQETGRIPTSRRGKQTSDPPQENLPPPTLVDRVADQPPSTQKPEARGQNKKRDASASLVGGGGLGLELVSDAPDPVRQAFDAFNTLASEIGLHRAQKLDHARRAKIAKLLKEWGQGGWDRMLDGLRRWPHARGENDREWKADLEYVLRPDKFTRLVERAGPPPESALVAARTSPDHDATWSPRLADYDRDGTWHDSIWGPSPTDPGFQGPPRFRRKRAA